MPELSTSHFVLIPTYNTGELLLRTIRDAMAHWLPVWVVVDGSTDGTVENLRELEGEGPNVRVLIKEKNSGKGGAVLHGLKIAEQEGFTHVLVMDADGQHPAADIPKMMKVSEQLPESMILGLPIFDEDAPSERLMGRKIANFFVNVMSWWGGIGDSLFGFKLYPVTPLRQVMDSGRFARRYDFDAEVAVKLIWRGVRPVNVPCPCLYLSASEGGVSHFNYLHDNAILVFMFVRLLFGMIIRIPILFARKITGQVGPLPYARSENLMEAIS